MRTTAPTISPRTYHVNINNEDQVIFSLSHYIFATTIKHLKNQTLDAFKSKNQNMYSLYVSGRNKQLEQLKKISETDYQYQLAWDLNDTHDNTLFSGCSFHLNPASGERPTVEQLTRERTIEEQFKHLGQLFCERWNERTTLLSHLERHDIRSLYARENTDSLQRALITYSEKPELKPNNQRSHNYQNGWDIAADIFNAQTSYEKAPPHDFTNHNPTAFKPTINGYIDYHLIHHLPEPSLFAASGRIPMKLSDYAPYRASLYQFINQARWMEQPDQSFTPLQMQLIDFSHAHRLISERTHGFTAITQWTDIPSGHIDNNRVKQQLYRTIATSRELNRTLSSERNFLPETLDNPTLREAYRNLRNEYLAFKNQAMANHEAHLEINAWLPQILLKIRKIKSLMGYSLFKVPMMGQSITIGTLLTMMVSMVIFSMFLPGMISGIPLLGSLIINASFTLKMGLIFTPIGLWIVSTFGRSKEDLIYEGWADQGLWALRAHHIHQEHAPPQDDNSLAHNMDQTHRAGELGMQPVV